MTKFYYTCLLLLLAAFHLKGQTLVSSEFLGQLSRDTISTVAGLEVENGVLLYKLRYTWSDGVGDVDTASGLLSLPDLDLGEYPLVLYQHGTSNDDNDVPSRLKSGAAESIVYASFGFVTLAPDYFGLGDSPGFHPYVHARTEALAGALLLEAADPFLSDLGFMLNEFLFVSGYSQGGHAALALHHYLQDETEIEVTASTPMSGPHALSTVMRDVILGDEEYLFTGYIPYTVLSYHTVYDTLFEDPSEFFKPNYLPAINAFLNDQVDLTDMSVSIGIELLLNHGALKPKFMIRDSIREVFENEPDHLLQQLLEENDSYKWRAESPIRFYYCEADQQVPYENSLEAAAGLQARGSEDVEAVSIDPALDHGACARPAILRSIEFFKSFLPVSSTDPGPGLARNLLLYPNPAINEIHWEGIEGSRPLEVRISEISGKEVFSAHTTANQIKIGFLSPGFYLLSVRDGKSLYVGRFVKI